ncbi:MAG: O-methyltransferase [Muribaculaceae bacterium]|nr:O-methyltransferase [Muribaculaceae bacterium]
MTEQLEDYILAHIDKEGDVLHLVNRDTHVYNLRPRMCSGHLQGKLLKMFVRMIKPRRVLELGTFTGYSALAMAEGLAEDAELHTVEIDDELEDFICEHFEASPRREQIHLHIGDATMVVPQLGGQFDLVFIDANKRNYCDYYHLVMPLVPVGGFIIADNTLWDGKVANLPQKIDSQTAGILAFNDLVANDDRVEKVVIPIRDGLTVIHKIKNS